MKQTIRVGDSLSGKLHDEISADLKGYVTVQVKNTKTGEIEHQENHNLIVYGGREWLLRRIFGSTLSNNTYAENSGIKWVGFGCGGGEAGNPLQAGTTFGHDTDLYQPCRIRFSDDSVTDEINSNYASRVLPNGSKIPGYYKKISNITIKEDHANPYIENNIRKFPKIIAELRIELSSDDCNGENYTENGNLVAYQDINEVALFASDTTIPDPGQTDVYDEICLDVIKGDIELETVYTNKKYYSANITYNCSVPKDATNLWQTIIDNNDPNYYILQYRIEETGKWIPVCTTLHSYKFVKDDKFVILRDSQTNVIRFRINDQDVTIPGWSTAIAGTEIFFRLISVGMFTLQFKNALSNDKMHKVECELQYRNYSTQNWKTIDSYTFKAEDKISIHTVEVACNNPTNPDIDVISCFRVRETINSTVAFHIKAIEKDETSYNLKCFVSNEDIKNIKVGNFVYTEEDTVSGNTISRSAPLSVIEVFDPEEEKGEVAEEYDAYFIIERQQSQTHQYPDAGLTAWTYAPSKASPYTMFSRVTLSSIRKSVDREIVLIWKIYC